MLPVQDVVPSRTPPRVTLGLITLIVVVLAFELLLSEHAARGLILSYGLVPAHVSGLTLVTSAFLHYGVFDAAVNALALWIFGDNVEDRLGHRRHLLLFLAATLLSGLAGAALSTNALAPMIGAAGGAGAVIGAHLVLFRQARVLMLVPTWRGLDLVEVPSGLVVMAWLLLTSLTAGGRAAPLAGMPLGVVVPVTGLLAGAAAARLLARPDRLRCTWWNVPVTQVPDRRRTSRETSASSASSASN